MKSDIRFYFITIFLIIFAVWLLFLLYQINLINAFSAKIISAVPLICEWVDSCISSLVFILLSPVGSLIP